MPPPVPLPDPILTDPPRVPPPEDVQAPMIRADRRKTKALRGSAASFFATRLPPVRATLSLPNV
jgi:hypothetical protein